MHIFYAVCSCIFQLQLAVYYESLCPDSARFIVEQLHPLKRSPLGKYVDVTLVPFGKANVSKQYIYTFVRQASSMLRSRCHGQTFIENTYLDVNHWIITQLSHVDKIRNEINIPSIWTCLIFLCPFFLFGFPLSFRLAFQYSTLGSDVQFTCQHGPDECYGNKVHSCALEHIQVSREWGLSCAPFNMLRASDRVAG